MGAAVILAIDPGPVESAFIYLDDNRPFKFGKVDNDEMRFELERAPWETHLVIEMVACYGMAVGAEVFDTCVWIGRFVERWYRIHGVEPALIKRATVKAHICGTVKAKDANVRQALIDRFSGGQGEKVAKGTKREPGPLYGVSGDVWAALAVAVAYGESK